jgi:hypothetical protein
MMEFSHGKTSGILQVGDAFHVFVSMLLSSQINNGASPQTRTHPHKRNSEPSATSLKRIESTFLRRKQGKEKGVCF